MNVFGDISQGWWSIFQYNSTPGDVFIDTYWPLVMYLFIHLDPWWCIVYWISHVWEIWYTIFFQTWKKYSPLIKFSNFSRVVLLHFNYFFVVRALEGYLGYPSYPNISGFTLWISIHIYLKNFMYLLMLDLGYPIIKFLMLPSFFEKKSPKLQ